MCIIYFSLIDPFLSRVIGVIKCSLSLLHNPPNSFVRQTLFSWIFCALLDAQGRRSSGGWLLSAVALRGPSVNGRGSCSKVHWPQIETRGHGPRGRQAGCGRERSGSRVGQWVRWRKGWKGPMILTETTALYSACHQDWFCETL